MIMTSINYSCYRLNDESELSKYQKDLTRYNKFLNRVFSFLDSLVDGETVDVQNITDETTIEIFIKVVCLYILYRNPTSYEDSYIIFSTDYSKILRVPGFKKVQRYHNNFYENK